MLSIRVQSLKDDFQIKTVILHADKFSIWNKTLNLKKKYVCCLTIWCKSYEKFGVEKLPCVAHISQLAVHWAQPKKYDQLYSNWEMVGHSVGPFSRFESERFACPLDTLNIACFSPCHRRTLKKSSFPCLLFFYR